MLSNAANAVIIRDQNSRKRSELVTSEAASTREPRFSVFTRWHQGMVSRLFHNVALAEQMDQKLSEAKDEASLPKQSTCCFTESLLNSRLPDTSGAPVKLTYTKKAPLCSGAFLKLQSEVSCCG